MVRSVDEAKRWLSRAFPDDDYLPPETPATPRLRWPEGPAEVLDGKVKTAIGPLTAQQFLQCREEKLLDVNGEVPSARKRRSWVPPTLEQHLAENDAHDRIRARLVELHSQFKMASAEEHASMWREKLKARDRSPIDLATMPTPCFVYRSVDHPATEELCDALEDSEPNLFRPPPLDLLLHGARFDDDILYPSFEDDEEEAAWEEAHGLAPGTFEAERARDLERAEAAWRGRQEATEAHALTARWLMEVAAGQHDGRYAAPGPPRLCANPNGCDNPLKGARGTRCAACYRYRQAHHGEERSSRLINRGVARQRF